ncbi:hypothetical protein [Pseudoxanthomonas mexicana]|uniref:hypothetical protein n=1 Tax=Pseudoxanthomonas mexicana TaxID=128785 RepID=UPI00209FFCBB|nr:hypothetical protein [Pseudoxanthomonas mexicana]MCP1584286.1 hypothetical protein [Pseudoxanthomonas mexicana]
MRKPLFIASFIFKTTALSPLHREDQSAATTDINPSQQKNTENRLTHDPLEPKKDNSKNTKKHAESEKHALYNDTTSESYLTNWGTLSLLTPELIFPTAAGNITATQIPKIVTTTPAKPISAFNTSITIVISGGDVRSAAAATAATRKKSTAKDKYLPI